MKKALIIGAAGFVGNYLIDYVVNKKEWTLSVTKMKKDKIVKRDIEIFDLDILNKEEIDLLLERVRPDYIFHLAAQSSVELSWKNPLLTVDVNIKGSLNVLEAIKKLDYKPRVILVGSGDEYGRVRKEELPITEESYTRPENIYAVTKSCQNMLGRIYSQAYGLDIMMVRAFNHIGPSQHPGFVVADFCKQVAEIEKGIKEPVIYVGNLNVARDFTDVRDVVRAYYLLMERGICGETYNVGSGRAVTIQKILEMILAQSNKKIRVVIDERKFRPIDVPVIQASVNKIKECTGWSAKIPLQQTLFETLNYWRMCI